MDVAGAFVAIELGLPELFHDLRAGEDLPGTGRQQPQRIPVLREYLDYLDEIGFKMDWVRTDFCFEDVQQAQELVRFFFGEEMLANLQGLILPECTGLWWLEK